MHSKLALLSRKDFHAWIPVSWFHHECSPDHARPDMASVLGTIDYLLHDF